MEIQLDQLPFVPLTKCGSLPACHAVYFALSASGECLYIGKASSLLARWQSGHHRKSELLATGNVRLAWVVVEDFRLLAVFEREMILRFTPKLNVKMKYVTVSVSFPVTRTLKADIQEESFLRGHTRSQALEQIIKLGLPRYLKRFPKKFERIDTAA